MQAVARSRSLRRACPCLFRDVLAVLSRLRPAFLLDYGALGPADLAAAAADVAAALRLDAARLAVLVLNDCCYLVQPDALPELMAEASPGAAADAQPPAAMFIAFDQQPAPQARWATGAEAAAAAAQLGALRQGLLAAVGNVRQQGQQQQQQFQQPGTSSSIPVVDAQALPGWQALAPPTASGYLLGYPALYLCHDLASAQAATRCLSSSSLCLHSVACDLGGPAPRPEGQPLLAFSVPQELAAAPEWAACRAAWWARLQQRRRSAAVPWGEPQLAATGQAPRPVAL